MKVHMRFSVEQMGPVPESWKNQAQVHMRPSAQLGKLPGCTGPDWLAR